MKIVLFGANGGIAQRILADALARGHEVTAVVRDPQKFQGTATQVVSGDATDPTSVAEVVRGHDAVITAIGPSSSDVTNVVKAAQALLEGLPKAGVKRLLVVGGAGSLEVAPGVRVLDNPEFPAAWRPVAEAHSDALDVYKASSADVDWTYFSPPALIEPGERTGQFRLGKEQLIVDAQGQSCITYDDYAQALLDELEKPQHIRQRFTIGY